MEKVIRSTFITSILMTVWLSIGLTFPVENSVTSAEPKPKQEVCFSLEEAADIRRSQIDLREEIAKLRAARLRKLGFNLGCGVGAGSGSDSLLEPQVGCYATFGWRF